MGVELVKQVVGHPSTSRLSGNAYKALVSMALQALDKPKDGRPAGLYFGGWEALQLALGYEPGGVSSAAHTAVKRAVRELKDGKHITPMVTAARGSRQSYLVHPGGLQRGSSGDPQSPEERGSLSDPKRGSSSDPKRGSESDPNGGHSATHLGHIEEGRGLNQDEQLIAATSSTDRATNNDDEKSDEVSNHAHVGSQDDDCRVCGRSKLNRVHSGFRPLRAV